MAPRSTLNGTVLSYVTVQEGFCRCFGWFKGQQLTSESLVSVAEDPEVSRIFLGGEFRHVLGLSRSLKPASETLDASVAWEWRACQLERSFLLLILCYCSCSVFNALSAAGRSCGTLAASTRQPHPCSLVSWGGCLPLIIGNIISCPSQERLNSPCLRISVSVIC